MIKILDDKYLLNVCRAKLHGKNDKFYYGEIDEVTGMFKLLYNADEYLYEIIDGTLENINLYIRKTSSVIKLPYCEKEKKFIVNGRLCDILKVSEDYDDYTNVGHGIVIPNSGYKEETFVVVATDKTSTGLGSEKFEILYYSNSDNIESVFEEVNNNTDLEEILDMYKKDGYEITVLPIRSSDKFIQYKRIDN